MYKIQNNKFHNSKNFNFQQITQDSNRMVLRSNTNTDQFQVNFNRTNFGKFGFQHISIQIWNFLDPKIKKQKTLLAFKKQIKQINWKKFTLK